MPEVEDTKEQQELTYGLTFKQYTNLMLSTKVFNEIYRQHFPDADKHTLEQMYVNIKAIGAEEKTLKVLEQLAKEEQDKLVKVDKYLPQRSGTLRTKSSV
jgi:hypothetical protein